MDTSEPCKKIILTSPEVREDEADHTCDGLTEWKMMLESWDTGTGRLPHKVEMDGDYY